MSRERTAEDSRGQQCLQMVDTCCALEIVACVLCEECRAVTETTKRRLLFTEATDLCELLRVCIGIDAAVGSGYSQGLYYATVLFGEWSLAVEKRDSIKSSSQQHESAVRVLRNETMYLQQIIANMENRLLFLTERQSPKLTGIIARTKQELIGATHRLQRCQEQLYNSIGMLQALYHRKDEALFYCHHLWGLFNDTMKETEDSTAERQSFYLAALARVWADMGFTIEKV